VVELRATLNWFETRPLFGRTIVVTRSRQSKSAFIDKLEALGARVLEAPTIKFFESTDATAIESALAGGELPWDWVIFPSDTGVAYAKRKLFDMGLDCRAFGRAKIAVMGNATAAAVREQMGLRVDLTPPRFVAESLADELERLGQVAGQRFLILRADIGRPTLRDRLHRAGAAEVRDVPIYETRAAATLPDDVRDALAANAVDWITFTSSSTATNFTAMLGPDYRHALAHVRLASIGPVTTDTLTALGLRVDAQAAEFNIDGLVDAVTLFHGRAPAAGGSSTGPGVGSPTAY
jgi:uroporphyrinogen III methyltransferase/synthase